MTIPPLGEGDVATLARASGLEVAPSRIAALAATLPIVNEIRAALWSRPERLDSEPAHLFSIETGLMEETP